MDSLNALALRNLTAHLLRSVLTALAITLGVGMVLAASIVGQAAGRGTTQLAKEGAQVQLEVFSRDGSPFEASTLDAIRASGDVQLASPSLRVLATASPRIDGLALMGVEPHAYQELYQPELADGAFLDKPDTIVLPMSLAFENRLEIGDWMALEACGRQFKLMVSGRLKTEQSIIAPIEQVAYVPLEAAQTCHVLQNPTGLQRPIDHIAVVLRPGADIETAQNDLAKRLGGNLVVTRAVTGGSVMGNVALVQAGLAVVGLIILFAAGFVILNAFAMSITARTQEIGALRALGMTRRQVMGTVLTEAGVLGVMGTGAGIAVGLGLAWVVMQAMGTLQDSSFGVPWWGVALSVVMGLGVTLVAALQPAWSASRIPPIVAVRPEGQETRFFGKTWLLRGGRVGWGVLGSVALGLVAFGLLVRPGLFVALAVMVVGQGALLGAVVLLLPALVDPLAALSRPLLARWLGTEGRLAADNLGRNKLRTVLTAGALIAGLTIIVATSGLMTAGLKGSLGRLGGMLHEDTFITADVAAVAASGEMSVENFFQYISENPKFDLRPVVTALGPLVESGAIKVERCRFAPIPPELAPVPGEPGILVDPDVFLQIGNFDFFEGDPQTAADLMRRGRAVLLMPVVAERLNVHVGDTIPVQTPHGEVQFTVAGIGGSGWMMTVLSYADGEAYFDVTAPTHLGIVVSKGQDVESVLAQVRETVKPFGMTFSRDYGGNFDPLLAMVDRLELLLNALVLLAVAVAALGVVNTMVINVTERRREIALLRAVGATQGQVRRSVVAEAAALGLLAALVADVLGLLMLLTWGVLILPNGVNSLGVRPDWETIRLTVGAGLRDWGIAALVALIFGPLVAALAAYIPARQAASLNVVEAARSE